MTNIFYLARHYLTIPWLFYVSLFPGPLFLFSKGLDTIVCCSFLYIDSHVRAKIKRIVQGPDIRTISLLYPEIIKDILKK